MERVGRVTETGSREASGRNGLRQQTAGLSMERVRAH